MNDHLCSICQTVQPEFICFCSEVRLCGNCISRHLLAQPSLSHRPLPLASRELIQSFRMQIQDFKDVPMGEVRRSESGKRLIIEREMRRLVCFQSEALLQLQRIKVHYEAEIAKTVEEISLRVHEETLKLSEDLEKALSDLSDKNPSPSSATPILNRLESMNTEEDLLLLSLEVKPVDLSACLRQAMAFTIGFVELKRDTPKLYKFFGGSNSVSVFDGEKETFEKMAVSSQKFLHNSCWCVMPSGEVVITGGSLTGRSRNSTMLFSSTTSEIQDLEPMTIARRSHASLYYQGGCYVFGGVLDEEKISLCERYDWESGTWSSLPQMKERRAYHGCCVYNNLLFVCGGGETSSCEVFDPSTKEFSLTPLPQNDFSDVASIMPIGESIYVFHGNFNGEVSRLCPQSGQVLVENKLCYGNSWSSCAPILVGDTVFMLRSDSIFKYNVTTGCSSYVLRLAKAVKRREYE